MIIKFVPMLIDRTFTIGSIYKETNMIKVVTTNVSSIANSITHIYSKSLKVKDVAKNKPGMYTYNVLPPLYRNGSAIT